MARIAERRARPRAAGRPISWAVLALWAAIAAAQDDDVPPPPRIDAVEADRAQPAPSGGGPGTRAAENRPGSAPNAARLAPLPDDRGSAPDEIVVIGSAEWRLPDLGSAWRAERDAEERAARLRRSVLPLYDPDKPPPAWFDTFLLNREAQRIGYIELFRVRIGGRSDDD